MARQARKASETGYYHVMMRGNNKTYIFQRESDKSFFMDLLNEFEKDGLMQLAAWCIMDNHVHMVLKADLIHLAMTLKRLNIRYAMYYHRVHGTVGHVFQDRFKSETIETDDYLMMVIRYVHQNPVKAKITTTVEAYPWSSYRIYLEHGQNKVMDFVDGLFNKDKTFFRAYHTETDENSYLEIREDQEKMTDENVQKVIMQYCHKHGIQERAEIHRDRNHINALVNELITYGGISLRGTAKLLEIPYSAVRECRKSF